MKIHNCVLIGVLGLTVGVSAQVPSLLNYQGYLQDASGNPATGSVNIAIALYTNASSGAAVYTEDMGLVALDKGIYSFLYGSNEAAMANALTNAEAWLELTISGLALSPRQRLVAVPYALMAKTIPGIQSSQNLQADRLDLLELKEAALSIETQAYNNPCGSNRIIRGNIRGGIVAEAFSTTNGFLKTVISARSNAYIANCYNTTAYVTNNTRVHAIGDVYTLVKELSINAPVYDVVNYLWGTPWNGPDIWCSMRFNYTDSTATSAESGGVAGAGGFATYLNPHPEKSVSTIQVYLRHYFVYRDAYESNTVVRTAGSNSVVIGVSGSVTSKITHSMLTVRGAREGNDTVYYSITDGSHTDSNLPLNVKNPIVTLSGVPTSYTISMRASTQTNATWGGTAISASALRYWTE